MTIDKSIFWIILLYSGLGSAQVFEAETLSNCLITNCDNNKMLIQNNFKEKYNGPRKMGGSISLYHNTLKKEYIFSYLNKNSEIEEFIYYVPTKLQYDNFLKSKNDTINIKGLGKVSYNDGKKYYQITIRKK